MRETHARVLFLDVMRGCAVMVMVLGHSMDAVLATGVRSSELFRFYDSLRGFTAPMFLTISGFAFSVATLRRWDDYHRWTPALRTRGLRAGLLLLAGYALHMPFFSFSKLLSATAPTEYARLFQVDVLQCLAVTLVALHALVLLSPSPAQFARRTLMATAAIVLLTPVLWAMDFAPVVTPYLSPYLNTRQASLFPLFPNAAFLLTGAVVGSRFLQARERGEEGPLFLRVTTAALVGVGAAMILDRLGETLYPPHDFWKASPILFLLRMGVTLSVLALASSWGRFPPVVAKAAGTLGHASLLVYVVHLAVVYGSSINTGLLQHVGRRLPPLEALGVAIGVLAAMAMLAYAWKFLRREFVLPSRVMQAGLASILLYLFFTKPY